MANNYLIKGPVTQELINLVLSSMSEKTDSGGHSAFFGQVRADEANGKRVKAIEYSAYEEMVKPEADKICKSVLSEFSDVRSVEIVHSTGIVKTGEISLFVLVSAGHRLQAMQACSKTVELVKERFPVWKKEIMEDGSHEWR
ncbi:MAG TPA: molybdenum cofactor biosynthesis protein MoaE [Bacteroidales bacterium]|nr:molybdenum cofactor biosynthesis protein MoaE [Bacteroidales bacterium]